MKYKLVKVLDEEGRECYAIMRKTIFITEEFYDLYMKDFDNYWWNKNSRHFKHCISTDFEKVKNLFNYLTYKPVVLEQKK